ncbi:hypothetical protein SAMN05428973_101693 [Duganella sp. OV510]|jgi:hypothetical protein|nr:hypothetical protein SAMN05428973_101693 [Duganella sp. OV510]
MNVKKAHSIERYSKAGRGVRSLSHRPQAMALAQ